MITAITQSLLNSWAMCPEATRRVWIENDALPPGLAARIGTGVHAGAEVNHRAKMVSGEDEPLSVVQDAARDGFVRAVQDEGVFFPPDEVSGAKKAVSEAVDTVTDLARCYHSEVAPNIASPILVEEYIQSTHPEIPIPFKGKPDVVHASGDKPTLTDVKTSGKSWGQAKADASIQPALYSWLYFENFGEWPAATFEVVVNSKSPKREFLVANRHPDDLPPIIARTQIMLRMIDAGLFPPADPGHWKCNPKWCGYWWSCPYIPEHKKQIPTRS